VVGAVTLATGSAAAAEDAVQEAIVRAWERIERGETIDRIDAWVASVALNLSRSGFRRLMAERRAVRRLDVRTEHDGPSGDRLDLEAALARLPRRQREAIVLRGFLGCSIREIAAVMGTSEGTVKSQLAKARAHLAMSLSIDDVGTQTETNHADA
jgi:RNA polymerase sigma-70 factor (ECF subfamily)